MTKPAPILKDPAADLRRLMEPVLQEARETRQWLTLMAPDSEGGIIIASPGEVEQAQEEGRWLKWPSQHPAIWPFPWRLVNPRLYLTELSQAAAAAQKAEDDFRRRMAEDGFHVLD